MFSALKSISSKYLLLLLLCCNINTAFAEETVKRLVIDFYGQLLRFNLEADFYSQRASLFSNTPVQEDKAKALIQAPELTVFVQEVDSYASKMQLDDLASLLMIQKAAAILNTRNDPSFSNLFTYAILFKQGKDVMMGIHDNGVTLYGHTDFNIKNVLFVQSAGKTYYDLSFDQFREPGAEKPANLPVNDKASPIKLNKLKPPVLSQVIKHKTIPFEYDGNIYFFTSTFNQSLVDYYHDLPDIEMSQVYLNYGLSEKGQTSLVNQLQEATAYMNKEKAVNFVLGFVQSLDYAKDAEVRGREKFAFPEEALADDFTDCEDRSMLFAYLVREVVNLQSIGLFYSSASHMNVAVENWRKKSTDSDLKVFDMDFVVCEPSAKGFSAGQQTMKLSAANVIKW